MSSLLALTWRCLLVLGLVFNPVIGMGMAHAADAPPTAAKAPPCHAGMAMAMQAQASSQQASPHQAPVPGHDTGKGCTHACQFAACCLVGTLDQPAPAFQPLRHGSDATHSHERTVAPTPPPSRMIRPPIA